MKTLLNIVALLTLATPTICDPLPDLNGRTVVVSVENAYPPLQFINPETAAPVGLEYDLMAEFAQRLNLEVRFEAANWPGVFAAILGAHTDIGMNSFPALPHHAARLEWSAPYLQLETVILLRASETRFGSVSDFPAFFGKSESVPFNEGRIGVIDHTPEYYLAEHGLTLYDENAHLLVPFPSLAEILQALRDGRVDLTLVNGFLGQALVEAHPEQYKLVKASAQQPGARPRPSPSIAEYRLLFPKGSELVAPFNRAIAEMQRDGTVQRLSAHWFAESRIGRHAMDNHPYGRGIGTR